MEQIAARCLFNEKKKALRKVIIVLIIINHLYGTLMNLWDIVKNMMESSVSADQLSWAISINFIEATDTVLLTEVLCLVIYSGRLEWHSKKESN